MDVVAPTYYNHLFPYSYKPVCSGPLPQTGYPEGQSAENWLSSNSPLTALCVGDRSWPTRYLREMPRPSEDFWPSLEPAPYETSPLCRCPYAVGNVVCYADRPGHGWTEIVSYCKENCECNPPAWKSPFEDEHYRRRQQDKARQADADQTGEPQTGFQGTSKQCKEKKCSSWASCFTGGNTRQACGNMICRVAQYTPGLMTLGTCVLSKGHRRVPLLGGRDLADGGLLEACACNSTYVSHGCCDAEEGLVWEEPLLKLGGLLQDPDLDLDIDIGEISTGPP